MKILTIKEAGKRYNIPAKILKAYKSWGFCGESEHGGDIQCGDADIERLSLIMPLYDIGFSEREAEIYVRLTLEGAGSDVSRLKMLEKKRAESLEDIHMRELRLARLDHLRRELQKRLENGSI